MVLPQAKEAFLAAVVVDSEVLQEVMAAGQAVAADLALRQSQPAPDAKAATV